MVEEPGPKREEEALPDPARDVVVRERDDAPERGQSDVRRGDRRKPAEVVRDQDVVRDELEQPDLGRLDRRHHREEGEAEPEIAAEGPSVRPEAAHDLTHRHGRRVRDEQLAAARHHEQFPESFSHREREPRAAGGVRVLRRDVASATCPS
jgi:hypothetical protein